MFSHIFHFRFPISFQHTSNVQICTCSDNCDNQKEQTFKRLWLIAGISLENLNECSNRCEMFLKLVVPPQTFMSRICRLREPIVDVLMLYRSYLYVPRIF